MTVVPEPRRWELGYDMPFDEFARRRQLERDSQAILDAAVASVPVALPLTAILARGLAGPKVVAEVTAGEHDLFVIGSRGPGAIRSLLLGSVSHHVLHASSVPVLIVPARPRPAERTIVRHVSVTGGRS
jgi:nucleotide-binding universal stress UspA family protein